MDLHALDLRDLAMFGQRPQLFEHFVELLLVGHRKNFLMRNLSMVQFNTPVGQPRHYGVVRDHHQSPALLVELTQKAQDDFFVLRVEVSGGLVSQNNFRIIDQGACDADALLLTAGKLRWQVIGAVPKADAGQRVNRFLLVSHAVKVLRQHDVLDRGEKGDEMELLEDESDFFRAHTIQFSGRESSSADESPATLTPSSQISPELGRSRQPIRFTSVDLPDPDGPMIESHSPGATSSEM